MSSPSSAPGMRSVIIVGGGLAGMSAAAALSSTRQWAVTLIESRGTWGGRASSYVDPETGEQLDNSQHILMGCCTNLLDFYARVKVADRISWLKNIPFIDDKGKRHALCAMPGIPAPLHMAAGFATFGLLTFGEKIAAARAIRAMLKMGKKGREQLGHISFGQWLDDHRQPKSLLTKLYDPVLIGALNEHTREVSAKYAIQVFQDALLAHRKGFLIGVATCPLSHLYDKLPGEMTQRLNTRVEELVFEGAGGSVHVAGVRLRDGEILRADAVILATNHHAVQKWIGPEFEQIDDRFARLSAIDAVPILGTYLVFDRPILREPVIAFTHGPLQWLFKKNAEGSAVAGVISASRAWVSAPKNEVLAQFEKQIQQMLPGAAQAQLTRGTVVIERRATFAPTPGIDDKRPAQFPGVRGIQGLYLAGDYTQTHWPATMEGAVRSGYLAAEALCGIKFLTPDLPVEWPARMMGLC